MSEYNQALVDAAKIQGAVELLKFLHPTLEGGDHMVPKFLGAYMQMLKIPKDLKTIVNDVRIKYSYNKPVDFATFNQICTDFQNLAQANFLNFTWSECVNIMSEYFTLEDAN